MILPRLGSLTVPQGRPQPIIPCAGPALRGRLFDALPTIISQAIIRLAIAALFFVHQRVVIRVGDGRPIRVNCRVG